ncbi:MAG TPA: protein translocase subunit SecF [Candidatus Eisenbacteria bacterium]|nr:protein translocase subunit SecF [Candidatus Eisenbacteria bacterium]
MLQILHATDIPFMRFRRLAYVFSGTLLLVTLAWFFARGPRYSVDFTGGTLLQVRTSRIVHPDEVRAALRAAGIEAELQQLTGQAQSEYLLRFKIENRDPFTLVQQALESRLPGTKVELRGIQTVGPKVGGDLRSKAINAILASLTAILLYVGFRYEFKFAFGGIVALFHDVLVTLGFLMFTGREVSLTVVAALLTIAGYSINDTIVVFDRIRERSRALRKEKHSRVMDIAVNETLSRTVITAFTVFLAALALFIWGGQVLRDFSFAMLIGTVFGTYSSVYVASALALDIWIGIDRRKGVAAG